MIVLVVNVSTQAQGKSSNASSSTNTESDLLQIEDRFNGNSQQDAPVDIGMFPRELKGNFSAVVESRIGISSADCMLLDSPPAGYEETIRICVVGNRVSETKPLFEI
jgi:hypothetical protein